MTSLRAAGSARHAATGIPRVVVDLAGYGLVSVVALACDWGLLVGLAAAGLPYLAASTISFAVGMAVAYALSIRFVFPTRRALTREAEAGGFFAVGMLGLVLTQVLLFLLVSKLGMPVALAKAPTAIVVFLFNFVCRRRLVFAGTDGRLVTASATETAASPRVADGLVSRSWPAGGAAALVGVAAAYAIGHPYLGIIGDASLYLGRSLADLDPSGVGRDIVFANDGQSRFSIFSRLVDPLVAALGAEHAGIVVALAASACVFAATLALARALGGGRRVTIAVALAATAMPTLYGAGIFRFAETSAVPRPFAEAAVMAFLAALLVGRPLVAGLLLAVAFAIHPIMAMAGGGTALVLLAWRRDARASGLTLVALVIAAGLALALGVAGVPLLDRLVVRVDPDWLGMLTARSPFLFPTLWAASAFAAPLVQATTIALAARHATPARRRVLAAVVISAAVQLAAAAVLGDALHGLLALQGQGWRALWLLAVLGTFCLPLVASELWREGAQARVALAFLGLAWLCPLGLAGSLLVCGVVLTLRARPFALPIRSEHATWGLAGVAAFSLLGTAWGVVGWAGFVGGAPWNGSPAFVAARQADVLVAPVWLAVAIWLLGRPRRFAPVLAGLVALAAVAVAAMTWDQRASSGLWGHGDGFSARADVPGPRSSEVLVVGGFSSSWFALGRPQYFSPEQGVSIVFSRPLAMEWRRRARALSELGLVPGNVLRPWQPLSPADHIVVTAAKIDALCRRDDAPAAVVVPDRDDAPAPSLPGAVTWMAPTPLVVAENFQPPQWHAIRGWVVAPCAASRPPELAKTGGR